jgi:hypothetical protein
MKKWVRLVQPCTMLGQVRRCSSNERKFILNMRTIMLVPGGSCVPAAACAVDRVFGSDRKVDGTNPR